MITSGTARAAGDAASGILASESGGAPPAAVVLRGERLDIADLRPVAAAGIQIHAFLAAMSQSTVEGCDSPVAAVGVIGIFQRDPANSGGGAPMATVFLEWPDGRWVHWRALVDPTTREIVEDTATIGGSAEGDPLPDRLGRWWSLGRRKRMTMHLRPTPQAEQVVH